MELVNNLSGYHHTSYVLTTSNNCERLFSQAGFALNSRRDNLLQSNIAAQLFLFGIAAYWNITDIVNILVDVIDVE